MERFWAAVDKRGPDECWPWIGARTSLGYGNLNIAGQTVSAHRFAYLLAHGSIPEGMDVLHSCDWRPCCNDAHLWVGTHLENMQDKARKGRAARQCGEENARAKLTGDQVRVIRARAERGEQFTALGREYGVSQPAISSIVHRKIWRHVI
jgi:hypothetical protein